MQYKRQTDTFRYGLAKWRIRQDDSFASTSSFFLRWKIIRARNINAAEQGSYLAGDDFISGQWYFCPATVRADNNSGLPQKHSFCGKREQSPDKRCFCRKAKRAQRRIVNAVAGNGGSSVGWRRGEIPMECFCKAPSVIDLKDWTVWVVPVFTGGYGLDLISEINVFFRVL